MTRTIPEAPPDGWSERHQGFHVTIVTEYGTHVPNVPIIPLPSPFGGVIWGPSLCLGRILAQAGAALQAMLEADAALMQMQDNDDDEDEQGGGLFVQ